MKKLTPNALLPLYPELHDGQSGIAGKLIIDNFAGGGGASTGIELAFGRPVDYSINHDPEAVALHERNHPYTKHFCESVWDVNPREITKGRPIALAWFSPDCTHFSKAKGGQPRSKKIRGLAWVVLRWASLPNKPDVIILENVEEFQTWGPLRPDGQPCKKNKGRTFRSFLNALKRHGYQVEHRELRACDYGAPTTRKRFFLIARSDGKPIVWPEPTHADPKSEAVQSGRLPAWRTAAECIDWSIPCLSIFDRKKELAENTLKRIARGLERYVFRNPSPFIVTVNHSGEGFRGQSIDAPMQTVTQKHGFGVVAPIVVKSNHTADNYDCFRGQQVEDPLQTVTQAPGFSLVAAHITKFKTGSTGHGADEPLHTIVSGAGSERPAGSPHGLGIVAAFLNKHYTGVVGSPLQEPIHTITSADHHSLTAAFFDRQFGNGTPSGVDEPLKTITTEGAGKSALVQAFLLKYYGNEKEGHNLRDPLGTVTTRDRFGLVTVNGEEHQLVDIGLRMLEPRELYRAQGFPESYVIDLTIGGKKLSKSAQVKMCGNSVCPPVARALVEAQFGIQRMQEAAD